MSGGDLCTRGEAVIKLDDRVVVGAIMACYKYVIEVRGVTSQCKEMPGGWKYTNIEDGCFTNEFHVNDADSNLTAIPDDIMDEAACYVTDMIPQASRVLRIPLHWVIWEKALLLAAPRCTVAEGRRL